VKSLGLRFAVLLKYPNSGQQDLTMSSQLEPELLDEENDDTNPPSDSEVVESKDDIGEEYYPVDYSITSYGADYPVDGLVKRLNESNIFIPTFQRSYVWNEYKASRFVESLLLGLPVPAIFLSREFDSNKLLVIDGQQRLRTLQFFYNGVFQPNGREFKLKNVQDRFAGKTYKSLPSQDRLRLDDSILHAIIIKQDSPEEDDGPSSIYHIFERLNTGGSLLQPQEIRTCIYHGKLIHLLDRLNQSADWRALFGKVSTRMRDRELILRFLALAFSLTAYSKPMKEFLNRFSKKHRNLDDPTALSFTSAFQTTVGVIRNSIGASAFRSKRAVNAALYDALMVGLFRRVSVGEIKKPEVLKARYDALVKNEKFLLAISSGTTDEQNVRDRISLATDAFKDAP
jgi:hypothetical protein